MIRVRSCHHLTDHILQEGVGRGDDALGGQVVQCLAQEVEGWVDSLAFAGLCAPARLWQRCRTGDSQRASGRSAARPGASASMVAECLQVPPGRARM